MEGGPSVTSQYEPAGGDNAEPIAIIGLACRVPGAAGDAELWRNLTAGVESIEPSTLAEQAALGVPGHWLKDPYFVPVSAGVADVEGLDAAFFDMSAAETELRDPQHRLFLELAYTALEDSGYDPERYPGEIGVYGGSGEDAYQWLNTRRDPKAFAAAAPLGLAVSSHTDYVATFTSFKLNLRGPSLTVHTACSTSLVAIHLACEALRNGECDIALGGAVNIDLPLGWGYMYFDGAIYSPDGHTRTFDAKAAGTMWSDGGGIVALKRLADALADGDHVRAVIVGNAINNDGRDKAGFTAPSQDGQAAVIAQALGVAGVDPRTISYVEAHGTGTAVGDPIEVAALSSVYRSYCADAAWCGLGSVKTNIGHLGPAAGVAGVIKTVLAMEHGLIPPTLNFETPNPEIDFAASPFYVSRAPTRWERGQVPRRAGVSSFGVGGTNAHVVMQEAPARPRSRGRAKARLIRLSARTGTALDAAAQRLAGALAAADGDHDLDLDLDLDRDLDLADVAYTLRAGRRELPHRLAVVATGPGDAASALASPRRRISGTARPAAPRVAFMFPGQGAQYPGMGSQLYRAEPVFRAAMDECAAGLAGTLDEDLREIMFAPDGEATLRQTAITQPALFTIEYALARLWQSWGVEPAAMIGHSIGEFVAATLAGVYALPDALRVVAARGRLMQRMAPGAMLAVRLDEAVLLARLPAELAIAAVNGPGACVVSGPTEDVADFARQLDHDGVGSRRLVTSHAFHSPMMEPALAEFRSVVDGVRLQPPRLGFLSNVSGEWMTAAAATDPAYWASQLVEPVRFGGCLATLLAQDGWLLLECGPGSQLCRLAGLQTSGGQPTAVPSLPGPADKRKDAEVLLAAAGQLWTAGVALDEGRPGEPRRRVSLPGYPWERKPYWIKPGAGAQLEAAPAPATDLPVDAWFAVPVWRQLPPLGAAASLVGPCLVFADPDGPSGAVVGVACGGDVVRVRPGEAFGRDPDGGYTVRPGERADYDALIADLARTGLPARIVHAWALDAGAVDAEALDAAPEAGALDAAWRAQDRTFFSLLNLVQAVAGENDREVHLDILTAGACDVTGADLIRPEHATVAGIVKVTPLELPWLSVRHIDLDPGQDLGAGSRAARQLSAELANGTAGADGRAGQVALRAGRRWRLAYEQLPSIAEVPGGPGLREGGVYVITGGLGGIGITLAEDLATRMRARLVLVSRSGLPPEADPTARRAIAAIRRMEDSGAEVLVLAEDVATADGARRVREAAVARFGRVDGIVHAAGVPGGGMAEVKERSAAEQVLAPKLLGTLALRDAFGDLDLDFVVLCSSVTAVAGGFGQVDYCAANSFLDAHARGSAHDHGWRAHVVSANWGGWRDVGMAAEVAAPAAFRALQRGDPMTAVQHPVLTGRHEGEPGWCGGVVSASTHWILDEHRLAGVPVVPGTGFVEAARAAFAAVVPAPDPGHLIELRDVVFIEPMMVPDGTSAELRVVFSDGAEGFDFRLISLAGGVVRTHVSGTAAWAPARPAAGQDLDAIRQRCSLALRDGAQSHSSGLLAFGPRWSSARHTHVGHGEELTRIEANQTVEAELGHWGLHPALLDEATATGWTEEGRRYLPLGYGGITVRQPLTSRFWSHLRRHDTAATDIVTCDITLLDDSGRELVSITDFALRQVDSQAVVAAVETAAAGRPASEDRRPGLEAVSGPGSATGIRPADGAEAFRLLLGADPGPQVVIAAQPVSELMAATQRVTQESVESDLGTPAPADHPGSREGHVAPRNELEAAIALLWREVLGGEELSVTDNFFDIGGNSLVAVQLIALVRREFGVRLPMRSLFEDPTVEGAAAKVAELRTPTR
jgi:acyl transferase domain-containing protein/acyl carrier protein